MTKALTHHFVCHLLAQHEVEVWRFSTLVLVSGLELNKDPVLQEVVELRNARIQVLRLEVIHPVNDQQAGRRTRLGSSLFLGHLYLIADDVSILDLVLLEGLLHLHTFDHAGFDFLYQVSRVQPKTQALLTSYSLMGVELGQPIFSWM